MVRFLSHRGILLVAGAFVVFTSVRLPVSKAHPTKVEFAFGALNVITTAILLNTRMTIGAVLGVSTDIIGGLAIIRALNQPFLDDFTRGRRVIVLATFQTKTGLAGSTRNAMSFVGLAEDNGLTTTARTPTEERMGVHEFTEQRLLVFGTKTWLILKDVGHKRLLAQ
jgi:hypothetical protein